MQSTSTAEITARSSTLVNSAILRFSSSGISRSARHRTMSGWMPISRSSFTECCVGLVLISPADGMNGTSVRWMKQVLLRPSCRLICRIASRKGSDSMSPTVPPISTIATCASPAPIRMKCLISSVMCGITCTVPPR